MNRAVKLVGIVGLTAVLALTAFPVSAREDTTTSTRGERLHLECQWAKTEAGPGIGCRWSPSHHPAFAEYRLVRGERGGGHAVVFQSGDRRHTWYLDTGVEPATAYVYIVFVLDGNGEVIGRSDPAGVRPARSSSGPESPELPELPELPEVPEL